MRLFCEFPLYFVKFSIAIGYFCLQLSHRYYYFFELLFNSQVKGTKYLNYAQHIILAFVNGQLLTSKQLILGESSTLFFAKVQRRFSELLFIYSTLSMPICSLARLIVIVLHNNFKFYYFQYQNHFAFSSLSFLKNRSSFYIRYFYYCDYQSCFYFKNCMSFLFLLSDLSIGQFKGAYISYGKRAGSLKF